MAWSFFAGSLAPGESVRWSFWWEGNPYKGIQVVQAKPVQEGWIIIVTAGQQVELRVLDQSLVMDEEGRYTYAVTVQNVSPYWAEQYRIVGQRVD
jgi:hypothetical protein